MAGSEELKFCGYLKLSGSRVSDGIVDAKLASDFLSGIDKSLRYFITKDSPAYSDLEYNLEVKIEPGSLIVYLVDIGILALATYAVAAAKQLAKNDVGDKNSTQVLGSAARKMRSTVKIAKHLGGMSKKRVEEAKFKENNQVFAIPNSKGELLYVRRDEWESFFSAPENLYEEIVSPVGNDTSLLIGARETSGEIKEEEITEETKLFFSKNPASELDDELTLPELIDGETVELEGELTRGNGRTNTLGFAYKDHIITCTLRNGRVKEYKDALFGKVRVTGVVTRHYESKVSEEEKKKPKLVLSSVQSLEDDTTQQIKLM